MSGRHAKAKYVFANRLALRVKHGQESLDLDSKLLFDLDPFVIAGEVFFI